jgi:hypothetical protein
MATKTKSTIYNDNQFSFHKQTRHEKLTSGQGRRRRGHLPLWMDILIILVIVAVAGTVGFILTHPSPHRSADGIATDFAHQVGSGNYLNASKDVDPSEQASALSEMRSKGGLPSGDFAGVHTTQLDSSNVTGTTASVVLKSCNSSLACNPLPAIPCEEIGGKWYVDWGLLIDSTSSS